MARFSPEIRDFGRLFVFMQDKRHSSDYDPSARFPRSVVAGYIDETDRAIARFENAPAADRRAFALYVLLRVRR